MVWACGKNGRVPYGQKGVDGGSKWLSGARLTEFRLDGWCAGGLGNRGMRVKAARQWAKDRKEWRALMHMYLDEFHA